MRLAPTVLLALVLTGCTAAPRPLPVTSPPPRVVSAPRAPLPAPPVADWLQWPVTPGTWRYSRDERGTLAMFGQVGANASAVLRCDRRGGRVFLSVAGDSPTSLTVRTNSVTRTVPLGATGGTPPYLAATFTPADPLLDAMAFSRGRFAFSRAGTVPLVLPAWAEVGRVVEDCRA